MDVFIAPEFQLFTTQHLKQYPGPSARGVLFFSGGHITGTHVARIGVAAGTYPHASGDGIAKIAVVVLEGKVGTHRCQTRIRAHPEIIGGVIGAHRLSRIELPVGVPDFFEFGECLDKFLAIHDV